MTKELNYWNNKVEETKHQAILEQKHLNGFKIESPRNEEAIQFYSKELKRCLKLLHHYRYELMKLKQKVNPKN